MRFFWLGVAIAIPLIAGRYFGTGIHGFQDKIYFTVFVIAEVIAISFAIAESFKHRKEERYQEDLRVKQDRDTDIIKWRKSFMDETLGMYDLQKATLQQAKELGKHQAHDFMGNINESDENQKSEVNA